jgi:partitioning defective protein 6
MFGRFSCKCVVQVTDMMVANSSNLIITVKPANQRTLAPPRRGSFSRTSQLSSGSHHSTHSAATTGSDDDRYDQDEIVDLTGGNLDDSASLHLMTGGSGTADKDGGVLHL